MEIAEAMICINHTHSRDPQAVRKGHVEKCSGFPLMYEVMSERHFSDFLRFFFSPLLRNHYIICVNLSHLCFFFCLFPTVYHYTGISSHPWHMHASSKWSQQCFVAKQRGGETKLMRRAVAFGIWCGISGRLEVSIHLQKTQRTPACCTSDLLQ